MSVEPIVGLLAQGGAEDDVLRSYPKLSAADIQASLSDASAVMRSDEEEPGTRDPDKESRVLITFDADFGELAFGAGVAVRRPESWPMFREIDRRQQRS